MTQRTVPANELAIKALRCPDGKARVVYHVDGHGNEGLKLYVESSGTKTWYYRARVAGSATKDMPLGRWPDVTIAEARKRKGAIVVTISRGEDPWHKRAEERRRKEGTTLNEAFSEWLETVACNKRTRDQDELRYAMNIRGVPAFSTGRAAGQRAACASRAIAWPACAPIPVLRAEGSCRTGRAAHHQGCRRSTRCRNLDHPSPHQRRHHRRRAADTRSTLAHPAH
jgi:hypothetical protein